LIKYGILAEALSMAHEQQKMNVICHMCATTRLLLLIGSGSVMAILFDSRLVSFVPKNGFSILFPIQSLWIKGKLRYL